MRMCQLCTRAAHSLCSLACVILLDPVIYNRGRESTSSLPQLSSTLSEVPLEQEQDQPDAGVDDAYEVAVLYNPSYTSAAATDAQASNEPVYTEAHIGGPSSGGGQQLPDRTYEEVEPQYTNQTVGIHGTDEGGYATGGLLDSSV